METKEPTMQEKLKFMSTSPVCDEEKYGIYAEILDNQVKSKNVYNIGIIAPYGAGKSSLIKTYKETKLNFFGKRRVTTISLANFNSIDKTNAESTSVSDSTSEPIQPIQDIVESGIEKSILEQFIFKESKSKLPHSRLKRIDNRHWWLSLIVAALMSITIALVCCSVLEWFNKLPFSNGNNFYYFFGFAFGSVFLLLFLLLYSNRLNKISVKDIEANICDNSNYSVLNTFIDEILYFFKKTKTNIVIIEDLDRFEKTHIFSKLRELNFLINNSKIVKQKVTFIYAVKDTLFKTENDRAKFFDYIISLVPVLSFTNARDLLDKEMKKLCPEYMLLPNSYICEVSHFITEMRILKNVINDYMTYYKILDIKASNVENKNIKLFSLIVYKNVRPSDFAELQFKKGELAKLFDNKKARIHEEIEILKSEIRELEKKQIQATELKLNSFSVFKSLIKGMIIDNKQSQQPYIKYTEIDEINTFKDFSGGLKFTAINRYGIDYYCTISYLEEKLGDKLINLENKVKAKAAIELSKVVEELKEKRLKTRTLLNCTMQEYIKEHESFVADDLCNYFLANGYIAEDYKEFVAHSDQDLLSTHDNSFVLCVLAKRTVEYATRLDNPLNVIREIPSERFSDKYVLNYDLVTCILAYEDRNQDILNKKDSLVKYLISREDSAKEFIKDYVRDINNISTLTKILLPINQYFLYDILIDDRITDNNKGLIMKCIIENFEKADIIKQNHANVLSDFLINYVKVIDEISIVNVKTFKEIANDLTLKVKNLECKQDNYDIANYLVSYNLYELNDANLKFIVCALKHIEINYYSYAPLTTLFDTQDTIFIDYISANIKEVLNIILNFENQCHESQATLEIVLKNNKLAIDLRKQFIDKQLDRYNYIENIEPVLLNYLFDANKITIDWKNILKADKGELVSWDSIKSFIFKNAEEFGNKELLNKDIIIDLCNSINYDDEDYESLKMFSRAFAINISADEIDDDFVCAILIENDKIEMVDKEYLTLTSKPVSIVQMLLKNNNLIDILTTSNFSNSIIEEVILNKDLSENIKSNIIKNSGYIPEKQEAIIEVKNILISYSIGHCEIAIVDKIMNNNEISEMDKLNFIGKNDLNLSFNKHIDMLAYISPCLAELKKEKSIKLGHNEISGEILSYLCNKKLCVAASHKYGIKITRRK